MEKIRQIAIEKHNQWRLKRQDANGNFKPHWVVFKDPKFISKFLGKNYGRFIRKVNGVYEIDIANLNFEDLNEYFELENLAAARTVYDLFHSRTSYNGREIGTIIHDEWLNRNPDLKGTPYDVPFSRLPRETQVEKLDDYKIAYAVERAEVIKTMELGSLDNAAKYLAEAKKNRQNIAFEYKGVMLYSELDDLDSCYLKVTGKTKQQYELALRNNEIVDPVVATLDDILLSLAHQNQRHWSIRQQEAKKEMMIITREKDFIQRYKDFSGGSEYIRMKTDELAINVARVSYDLLPPDFQKEHLETAKAINEIVENNANLNEEEMLQKMHQALLNNPLEKDGEFDVEFSELSKESLEKLQTQLNDAKHIKDAVMLQPETPIENLEDLIFYMEHEKEQNRNVNFVYNGVLFNSLVDDMNSYYEKTTGLSQREYYVIHRGNTPEAIRRWHAPTINTFALGVAADSFQKWKKDLIKEDGTIDPIWRKINDEEMIAKINDKYLQSYLRKTQDGYEINLASANFEVLPFEYQQRFYDEAKIVSALLHADREHTRSQIGEKIQYGLSQIGSIEKGSSLDMPFTEMSLEDQNKLLKMYEDAKTMKDAKEVRMIPGDLTDVARYLEAAKRRGENVYYKFHDKKLYSMLDNIDDCYMKITGETELQHEATVEKSRRDYEREQVMERRKIVEKIPEIKEMGNYLAYPQKKDEWDRTVALRVGGMYYGKDLINAIQTMEALDKNESLDEAKKALARESHSDASHAMVVRLVTHFSKRGPEFYRDLHKDEPINEKTETYLQELENDNREYEKSLQERGQTHTQTQTHSARKV